MLRCSCHERKMPLGIARSPLHLGFLAGLLFGSWNVLYSWLFPLADDTPAALLAFYGPMFSVWAAAAFMASRRTRSVSAGVTTGAVVAFATFCIYTLVVVVRVNLFLDDMTGRADWANLMQRFKASGYESLRTFVNVEYIRGAPLKIGVASLIGAVMGLIGGALGRLTRPSPLQLLG
jgi:hypothetical protein